MKRRQFITGLGGAAAWPLVAGAQTNRVRKIGVLLAGSENDAEMRAEVFALQKSLQELGWTEGRNVYFEFRWPNGDLDRTRAYVMEFVGLAPDVIVTGTTPAAIVLRRETRSIPVVFVNIADPVGTGVVRSLDSPGGNLTGFTAFELFRRNVLQRPDDRALCRELRSFCRHFRQPGSLGIDSGELRQAKVEKFGARAGQHDVSGL